MTTDFNKESVAEIQQSITNTLEGANLAMILN